MRIDDDPQHPPAVLVDPRQAVLQGRVDGVGLDELRRRQRALQPLEADRLTLAQALAGMGRELLVHPSRLERELARRLRHLG